MSTEAMKTPGSKCTQAVHAGSFKDEATWGINTPIFTSTSYQYLENKEIIYPRYFNIKNMDIIGEIIAVLENAGAGMFFGSGMAAITTSLFTFLSKGDHVVFQKGLYGGTHHFIQSDLQRLGIEFTIAKENDISTLEACIRKNTRVLYIETPSNPLLGITDISEVAKLAGSHGLLTMIDNTFASPINQNPHDLGMDLVLHSATKYIGGHHDLCAGAVTGSSEHIEQIRQKALNFGGSLNPLDCYLLERSMKTLAVRVQKQNENASAVARFLQAHPAVSKVWYPGLPGHPGHDIAKKQMRGFGGMLSFDPAKKSQHELLSKLKLIQPALSLGGVESIVCAPGETSHRLLSPEERAAIGITGNTLRLSMGIESSEDIMEDLDRALV